MGAGVDVLEITFTTVKAQDFDNTITTIPIYSKFNVYYKIGEIRIYLWVSELKDLLTL